MEFNSNNFPFDFNCSLNSFIVWSDEADSMRQLDGASLKIIWRPNGLRVSEKENPLEIWFHYNLRSQIKWNSRLVVEAADH